MVVDGFDTSLAVAALVDIAAFGVVVQLVAASAASLDVDAASLAVAASSEAGVAWPLVPARLLAPPFRFSFALCKRDCAGTSRSENGYCLEDILVKAAPQIED